MVMLLIFVQVIVFVILFPLILCVNMRLDFDINKIFLLRRRKTINSRSLGFILDTRKNHTIKCNILYTNTNPEKGVTI